MGNLVTTRNWEHFWLNEGFTVFVERKIAGRLHGREMLEFDSIIGLKALKESVNHFNEIKKPEFSVLCPCLKEQDPDDAYSIFKLKIVFHQSPMRKDLISCIIWKLSLVDLMFLNRILKPM